MSKKKKLEISMAFAEELSFKQIHAILCELSKRSSKAAAEKHAVGKTIRRRDTKKEKKFGSIVSATQKMLLIRSMKSSTICMHNIEPNKHNNNSIFDYIGVDTRRVKNDSTNKSML